MVLNIALVLNIAPAWNIPRVSPILDVMEIGDCLGYLGICGGNHIVIVMLLLLHLTSQRSPDQRIFGRGIKSISNHSRS